MFVCVIILVNMSKIQNIMVFYPTMEEFKYFSHYINHMELKGAHEAGIAKVCTCPVKIIV